MEKTTCITLRKQKRTYIGINRNKKLTKENYPQTGSCTQTKPMLCPRACLNEGHCKLSTPSTVFANKTLFAEHNKDWMAHFFAYASLLWSFVDVRLSTELRVLFLSLSRGLSKTQNGMMTMSCCRHSCPSDCQNCHGWHMKVVVPDRNRDSFYWEHCS